MESVLTKKQVETYGPKLCPSYGERHYITATVRYDDECGNGHNTFSITGQVVDRGIRRGADNVVACGCMHDEIAKAFPELAPLIKWHLVSSDGPMHYPGNAIYHAGTKDCWGGEKGEQKKNRAGLPMWQLSERSESIICSTERPTVKAEYVPVVHEGKDRELDAARSSAVWPDATDEDLTAPGLEERLAARLPALMAEFKAAVESLGFTY